MTDPRRLRHLAQEAARAAAETVQPEQRHQLHQRAYLLEAAAREAEDDLRSHALDELRY